jgi:outer membrane protein TolC
MNALYKSLIIISTIAFGGALATAGGQTVRKELAKTSSAAVEVSNSAGEPSADSTGLSAPGRLGIQTTQPLTLSLNDAIRRALENNNDIEVARTDVRIQESQLRSLLGAYDPTISLTPNYSHNATTGSTASNDFRVDSSFNRLISRGGGNYNVFLNSSQTGSTSQNNQNFNQLSAIAGSASTTYFSNLGATYTQPLFRGRQIDNTRRQIKIQRKRLEQSDAEFRRRTIEIIAQVQRAYWDLVFALRDQQNRSANLNLTKENLRQIEAQISAGKSAPLERAEVATELANREGDVLLAAQQVSIAENTFKQLILRDASAGEWTSPVVPTDEPKFDADVPVLDDALKDAMNNRPELRRLRLQREINEIDIRYFKDQVRPQLDFNSTFSLGGLSLGNVTVPSGATSPLILVGAESINANSYLLQQINILRATLNLPAVAPDPVTVSGLPAYFNGGTLRSLRNLFRTDAPNYNFGVTFSLPVGRKTARANLAGARIQQEQNDAQTRSQEQVVLAEVRNAVQAVDTSRQRVLTARRARENAEIQLQGERKLYEVGRSTTFLLFQRENALTNARNSEIRAETDYSKSLSELQRTTSTTFLVNGIEVVSPTK